MKMISFSLANRDERRLGVVLDNATGTMVAEIAPLQRLFFTGAERERMLPEHLDMIGFLAMGEEAQQSVALLLDHLQADPTNASREQGEFIRPLSAVRVRPPIAKPGKIICIGLNYRDHCAEQNKPIPSSPLIFAKYANTIIGPGDPIITPPLTQALDYETELAVVIGKAGKGISEADALNYVGGYMIMNDVTARDFQRQDGQFVRAKTQDSFAPCGPWLTTTDEIADAQNLSVDGWVNGEPRQHSNTMQMVFGVAYLISYISAGISLEVGDIIITGTPGGVGEHMNPPRYLKPGDLVRMEIGGLGRLENPVS